VILRGFRRRMLGNRLIHCRDVRENNPYTTGDFLPYSFWQLILIVATIVINTTVLFLPSAVFAV